MQNWENKMEERKEALSNGVFQELNKSADKNLCKIDTAREQVHIASVLVSRPRTLEESLLVSKENEIFTL